MIRIKAAKITVQDLSETEELTDLDSYATIKVCRMKDTQETSIKISLFF